MKKPSKSALICIFSYNVENNIENIFKKLKFYKHLDKSILFINDASSDATKIKIIKFKKNNKKRNLKIYNNINCFSKIFKNKVDYTMSSIVGINGLQPTLNIIKFTKVIAIL